MNEESVKNNEEEIRRRRERLTYIMSGPTSKRQVVHGGTVRGGILIGTKDSTPGSGTPIWHTAQLMYAKSLWHCSRRSTYAKDTAWTHYLISRMFGRICNHDASL